MSIPRCSVADVDSRLFHSMSIATLDHEKQNKKKQYSPELGVWDEERAIFFSIVHVGLGVHWYDVVARPFSFEDAKC